MFYVTRRFIRYSYTILCHITNRLDFVPCKLIHHKTGRRKS